MLLLLSILSTSLLHITAAVDLDRAYTSACLSLLRASAPLNDSFVYSPLSLTATLAVLHEGANDVARKEIEKLLLPGSSSKELTKFYSDLMKMVLSDTGKQNLLMATRLFARDSYKLDKKFVDQAQKEYQAGVESANFTDATASAKKINDFIATNTKDRIKNVVSPGDVEDAVLMLVNALSFTASWDEVFDLERQKRVFNGLAGKRDVQFMTAKQYNYQETSSAQVIGIQYSREYTKMQLFSFVIILPKPDQDFKEFKKNLSPKGFHGLLNDLKWPETAVYATIPKFSISSKMPAVEALRKLGVNAIFSAGNLKKIANDGALHVSDVKHEAMLKIHENGTDAAAVTTERMVGSALERIYFIADRPFLFALVAKGNLPVFLGQFV